MKVNKVFVTGADGFIGSHLAEALVRLGHDVTALAFYNSFDSNGWLDESELRNEMQIVRGDVRDAEQMKRLLAGQELVYHLAALISVPHSYEAPESHIETNVRGTLNILLGAKDAKRIVHTSSSEVYGTAQFVPMTEVHPISPQSPYAASKVGADAIARACYLSYGTPVVTLRPFNNYGPRQSERAVLPTIIRQALDPGCKEIKIGSLDTRRDMLFVLDTVEAFLALGNVDLGKEDDPLFSYCPDGHVFNAGTGVSYSIQAIIEAVFRVTGEKPICVDESRKRPASSEVMELLAGTNRIMARARWEPTTTFEAGIRRTVDWWRGRMDRLRPSTGYMT